MLSTQNLLNVSFLLGLLDKNQNLVVWASELVNYLLESFHFILIIVLHYFYYVCYFIEVDQHFLPVELNIDLKFPEIFKEKLVFAQEFNVLVTVYHLPHVTVQVVVEGRFVVPDG